MWKDRTSLNPSEELDLGIPRGLRGAWRSKAGLTLVEAVVAIMLFGICIAGACRLVMMTREMSDRARSHYTASNLGKNRLEKARAFGFEDLAIMEEVNTVVNGSGLPNANGKYRRSTFVTNVTEQLKEIRVTVEIKDRETLNFGPAEEVVSSYFADLEKIPE